MGQQTLQHCDEVPMTPPLPSAPVSFSAGSPGDGQVVIRITRGAPPPEIVPVPCGPPMPVDFTDATAVTLHFVQAPGGPASVDADW